jgi:hypothetical protein
MSTKATDLTLFAEGSKPLGEGPSCAFPLFCETGALNSIRSALPS